MSSITNKEAQDRLRRNADKWSDPLMDAGWTVLPSVILERQQALGLDPIDVNILLQLARHWWYADNPPHPSKKAIAECLGIKEITVRRHIAAMEAAGLIQRRPRHDPKDGRQQSNDYLFDGLIKAATPFAHEEIARRKKRKEEEDARRTRKRPQLHVVPKGSS